MKQIFKKNISNKQAFTLIEMTVVLFIISVLSLLIIPNVTSVRSSIDAQGKEALVTVIRTQSQLYELEKKEATPTLDSLKGTYLTTEQVNKAGKMGISLVNGVITVE